MTIFLSVCAIAAIGFGLLTLALISTAIFQSGGLVAAIAFFGVVGLACIYQYRG